MVKPEIRRAWKHGGWALLALLLAACASVAPAPEAAPPALRLLLRMQAPAQPEALNRLQPVWQAAGWQLQQARGLANGSTWVLLLPQSGGLPPATAAALQAQLAAQPGVISVELDARRQPKAGSVAP